MPDQGSRAPWQDIKTDHPLIRIWPKPWQPYALVMRLDRPIGIWLLFIPCLWGLSLGSGEGATRWG
ncbi:MAG: hypothetical protein AAF418_01890, partial [Pseudomonadota bacterium]